MVPTSKIRDERGAVLIHVALALIALLGFTAFVADYGVMWVSRRQAQNAADAGALAGALGLMFSGPTVATQSAQTFAAQNVIWSQTNSPSNVTVTLSSTTVSIPPCGAKPGCVRVDVYRNMPHRDPPNLPTGNPIPTHILPLLGRDTQGIRATATAEVSSGNHVKCLLPFAVADRWADNLDENVADYPNDGITSPGTAGWTPNDLFQAPTDIYEKPTSTSVGTGWTVSGDFGRQIILKKGDVGQFSAGWANKVDLPGSVGSADYRDDIKGCNDAEVGIAEDDPYQDCTGFPNSGTTIPEALVGCLGVASGLTVGPTAQGIQNGGPPGPNGELSVVLQDPGAHWSSTVVNPDPRVPGGHGGVVDAAGNLNMSSDRIRPIAVFDIAHYMMNPACVNQAGTGCVVRVANIIGFFIEGMCPDVRAANQLEMYMTCSPNPAGNNEVVGRIVTIPGKYFAGGGELTEDAAFLLVTRLVR